MRLRTAVYFSYNVYFELCNRLCCTTFLWPSSVWEVAKHWINSKFIRLLTIFKRIYHKLFAPVIPHAWKKNYPFGNLFHYSFAYNGVALGMLNSLKPSLMIGLSNTKVFFEIRMANSKISPANKQSFQFYYITIYSYDSL